ncbi:putative clathrin assembly protein At1g33340 [Oryza brachyantha]|uniref:putative clathrin assembly protein At1g33340 n=1 Tax=Oryza brachyantha TaxID=4533 RepID=UPI001AD96EAC|nr:putative clathrin assembly protein At1g33340 [Oryza brachyantha]
MKVFKGKIWAALGSLMDHAAAATASGNTKASSAAAPDRALLADIEAAVERCTGGAGGGGGRGGGGGGGGGDHDDRHVHEILFLVSNAPGAITFLSRRITARLEAARAPAAALRSLLLVHRLLRAGDRYFEQDLRGLWASRDLRIDAPRCSCSPLVSGAAAGEYVSAGPAAATGTCSFLHGYSAYLEERMQWVINQAGNLEPARPRPPPPDRHHHHHDDGDPPRPRSSSSSSHDAAEPLIFKLAMSQRLLDLAIQLLPDNNTSAASAAARSAFGIVLRESFKVYDAFKDGLDALLRSRAAGAMASKASRASAHEILKKACAQTPELKEFYHKCKRSNVSKSLDYPVVRVVTSAMELIMPPVDEEADADDRCCGEEEAPGGDDDDGVSAGGAPFATKLETTISTVWVEFDDGDDGLQHDAAAAGGGGDHSLQPTYSL